MPPLFFFYFSLSPTALSEPLLRPGRHYRSVPRHLLKRVHTIAVCPPFSFFFPLHLPCWGFLLQPGRHYRSVPWPLKQEKRYRSASLAAKLSRITVARKKMHLCFLRGPDRWRGYMGFYGGGLRFGILGLPQVI